MAYRDDLLDASVKYRAAGLSFVPVVYKSKTLDYGALRDTRMVNALGVPSLSECVKRIPSASEAQRWFGGTEKNIAIATGYNNVIAVDFDSAAVFDAWREAYPEIWRRTAIQKTKSGYHVFLRSLRRYRGFNRAFFGEKLIGHVPGYKRWISAWPSVLSGEGTDYVWLEGHAPWETGLLTVESLDEVGIRVGTTLGVAVRRWWGHVWSHNVIAKVRNRLGR